MIDHTDNSTLLPDDAAYQWHTKPDGARGKCRLCGYPSSRCGEHRRTRQEDGYARQFLVRKTKGAKVLCREVGPFFDPQRRGMKEGTHKRIRQAVAMLAKGQSMEAIAQELQCTVRALELLRKQYAPVWRHEFNLAVQGTIEKVRKDAGTDRVLADPDEYMRLATAADKWTSAEEQALFHEVEADLTLEGFFNVHFLPRLMNVTPDHRRHYRNTVNMWKRITGNPPLRLITPLTLAKFREALAGMLGYGGLPYSTTTIRHKFVYIGAILSAAGPAGPRCRDALGILTKVPYIPLPPRQQKMPEVVPLEFLDRCYRAAQMMDKPLFMGITPEKWWRALLVIALNTALRRSSLLKLRWEYVDIERNLIILPAEILKSRRPLVLPISPTMREHLAALPRYSANILPWPYCWQTFDNSFRKLQLLAGIPPEKRFGMHGIRRTAGTMMWKHSPEAAKLMLGHRSEVITMAHYINSAEVVKGALDSMPQPAAFAKPPAASAGPK